MTNSRVHQFSLLQRLLLAGGFFAAAGFNPNLVYAQVGTQVTPNTLPTGGSVAQGNATIGAAGIAANGRNTLQISQTSTAAVLNWSSFNVGSNGTVSFQQPTNGVTLNRVNSNQGSEIYGQINATGSVFLVNPAGILFAPGAQVNVGGLVASTLDITDNNFLLGSQTGNYQFNSTPRSILGGEPSNSLIKPGQIINQGTLTATGNGTTGGTIALLGQTVKNEGLIAARLGTVAMAAGQGVSLQFQGSRLIKVQVSQAEFDTLIDNKGIIQAAGGWVLMNAQTAAGLARAVVNHSGVIEAQTVADLQANGQVVAREGKVEILADFNHGTVNATGSVDISAMNTGALHEDSMPASGQNSIQNGGFVDTSATNVRIADTFRVDARAALGKSGTWLIDPTHFTIGTGSAALTTSGIGADTLGNNLATANVSIATASGGAEAGDILVNGQVNWSTANSLALTAHRNIDFTGGGSLNGSDAASSVTLTAGNNSSTGQIIGGSGNAVTAGMLIASAQSGIGSAAQALNTKVSQAALTNSTSGGIYVFNNGDVTVAASSANGNVSISTANGFQPTFPDQNGASGGKLTVGEVGAFSGITATGGNITLTSGSGSNGTEHRDIAFSLGLGGAGGAIAIESVIQTTGSVIVQSGHGGAGGSAVSALNGGGGGFGGAITVNAAIKGDAGLSLSSGNGGGGGQGGNWFKGLSGLGGIGGSGGAIDVRGALSSLGNVTLQAGAGGRGGDGGVGNIARTTTASRTGTGHGGKAGDGGAISSTVAGSIRAQNLSIYAGSGNQGGTGGVTAYTPQTTRGGVGGAGGAVNLLGNLSTSGDMTILAGAGGSGGQGGKGNSEGQQEVAAGAGGTGGAGGTLTLGTHSTFVLTSGGAASLAAGMGGAGGSGGPATNSTVDVAIGRGGDGGQGGQAQLSGQWSITGAANISAGAGGAGADVPNSTSTSGQQITAVVPTQNGGNGGNGGRLLMGAQFNAGAGSVLQAGAGGGGGIGGRAATDQSADGVGASRGGNGGSGGAGGEAIVSDALQFAAGSASIVRAGAGGAGGSGGIGGGGFFGLSGQNGFTGGDGGLAGAGGRLGVDASVSSAGDLQLAAGAGGGGGHGGLGGFGGFAIFVGNSGGNGGTGGSAQEGGSGGALQLNAAVSAQGNLSVSAGAVGAAGAPGSGGLGGGGSSGATGGANGQAGSLNVLGNTPGLVLGSQIELRAGANLAVSSAWGAITGNVHLQNGLHAADKFTLTDTTINAGGGNVFISVTAMLAGLNITGSRVELETLGDLSSLPTISATDLALRSHGSVGSAVSPLVVDATHSVWLEAGANLGRGDAASLGSGSAHVTLLRANTLGARVRNGSLDVRNQSSLPNSGHITVGSTAFGSGIEVTADAAALAAGRGHVSLTGGQGRAGSNNNDGVGGSGGAGGSITVASSIAAAGDITLSADAGGKGGTGSGPDAFGGSGGAGGAVTVNQGAALQSKNLTIQAGAGGRGGDGVTFANGGAGGQGGKVSLQAIHASGNVVLTSGDGGSNGVPLSPGVELGLVLGGAGGAIDVLGAVNVGGNLSITTGKGERALSGGAVSLYQSTSVGGDLVVRTGDGGASIPGFLAAGAGGHWQVHAPVSAASISASLGQGGNITLDADLIASGSGDAIRLSSQNFINNAGADAMQTSDPSARWIVWSNAPQTNEFGGIQSGNTAVWNTAYNLANPTVSESGHRFVFSAAQPTGVSIVANDVIKTYGDEYTFTAGSGYRLISLDNGASFGNAFTDVGLDVSGITLTGTPVLTSAGAGKSAQRDGGLNGGATYAIDINTSGVTASNSSGQVSLDAPVAGTLTINRANLNIRANDASRTYDGSAHSGNNGVSTTGFVNGESLNALNGSLIYGGTAAGSVNAGTYSIAAGGLTSVNYDISYTDGSLVTNKAALSITANNATRTYDGTTFSGGNGVSYNGFVNSETVSVLGGALTYGGSAQGSRNAGAFSITPGGLTAQNYNITFTSGSLTTNKANATLSATTDSRVYNGFAGSNTAPSAIGIVASDSVTLSQAFDSANAGNRTLNISSYTINDGNGGNNYNLTLQSANGSITPANLTITANNANMFQGQTLPLLSATYLGFVNGETTANLTTAPQINTSGNSTSPQGNYPIIASGAASPNYTISYVNGQLQITAAPLPPVNPPPPPAPSPAPAGSPAPSLAPASGPPAPAPAPASAPAPAGERTASGGSGTGSSSGSNSGTGNAAFAPETEEEKKERQRRLGKLFTIVGGGVQTQ